MDKVTVRVNATTANIGPGFDCVGMALSLYDRLTFEKTDGGIVIEGCDEKYRNENNLAYLSYKKTMEKIGCDDSSVKITIASEIPASRGLGSSAALIAAGAAAANAICGYPLTKEELLEIGTEIEGHPDNLAPAIYGGLTVSAATENGIYTARFKISEKFHFTALIPDFHLSTEKARQVLPKEVLRADAVYNLSRTALVLKAFEEGNTEMLAASMGDKLHQPYRRRLIKGFDTAERLAFHLGATAFFISGSGPTVMAVSESEDFTKAISEQMQFTDISSWRALALKPDNGGIIIE
ncbi:MAG: homoserine kinase [Oscillospiraceae bacterium]|nr:homoserine kinase [Oscillospiraceae bacterium]